MKSTTRKSMNKPKRKVAPVLKSGAGRWLLLLCEKGHLLRSIPYGQWTEARRRYGRKRATVSCVRCAREVEDE